MPVQRNWCLFLLLMTLTGEVALTVRAASAQQTHIPPHHPYIRYWGRVDTRKKNRVRFDWPGICIEAFFEGTSCALGLEGSAEFYNVFIDGKFTRRIETDSMPQQYELASGLADTVHHLMVTKRYETFRNITGCTGLYLDAQKKLLPLPPPQPFCIEFIGSSTLIGYGNEAKTSRCDSVALLSNCYYSLGPVAARLLGAEYSIAAITRKGLVRNYRSPFISSLRPFPFYYQRTLWNDSSSHLVERTARTPDVIVIMLGTNDFSTNPHPTRELFCNRYYAFVKELEWRYPGVYIVCLTSPREPFRTYVNEFVQREIEEGNRHIGFISYDRIPDHQRGCNWHPDTTAHRQIGEQLAEAIRPILDEKRKNARPTTALPRN